MHSQPDNVQRQKNTGENIYHNFVKNETNLEYQLRGKEAVDYWYMSNIDALATMMENSQQPNFKTQQSLISNDSGIQPQTPTSPNFNSNVDPLESQICIYSNSIKSDFGNITQM